MDYKVNMSQQRATIKEKDDNLLVECINRCAVHLTGQIILLLGIDEANCIWSQTKDSPEENKILEHLESKTYV